MNKIKEVNKKWSEEGTEESWGNGIWTIREEDHYKEIIEQRQYS